MVYNARDREQLRLRFLRSGEGGSQRLPEMMFGQGGIDGESIFKLVDLLQCEKKLPGDIDQPLDVADLP